MLRFKKDFILKVISLSLLASALFLSNSLLYSFPVTKDTLRVPVGQKSTYRKMRVAALHSFKRKYGASALPIEEALRYLDGGRSDTILVLHAGPGTEFLDKDRVDRARIRDEEFQILRLDREYRGRRYVLVITERAGGKTAADDPRRREARIAAAASEGVGGELFSKAAEMERSYDFEGAAQVYRDIKERFPGTEEAETAAQRLEIAEELVRERGIYERAHRYAKMLLFERGVEVKDPALVGIFKEEIESGMVVYDEAESRLHFLYEPDLGFDYVQECLDRAIASAKKRGFLFTRDGPRYFLGGTAVDLHEGDGKYRSATREDLREVYRHIGEHPVFRAAGLPVVIKGLKNDPEAVLEIVDLMDEELPRDVLKVICPANLLTHEQLKSYAGQLAREGYVHWFNPMDSPLRVSGNEDIMKGLVESARAGAVLALANMPKAAVDAPISPEGLLTLTHAEVLFMITVAMTVNPDAVCIYAGAPAATELTGPSQFDLRHGSLGHDLANVAIARLLLYTAPGLPSVHSAASTFSARPDGLAYAHGSAGRRLLELLGPVTIRHPFGFIENLAAFDMKKFIEELEQEEMSEEADVERESDTLPVPLALPEDKEASETIRDGGPLFMGHESTLRHSEAWTDWEDEFIEEADGIEADGAVSGIQGLTGLARAIALHPVFLKDEMKIRKLRMRYEDIGYAVFRTEDFYNKREAAVRLVKEHRERNIPVAVISETEDGLETFLDYIGVDVYSELIAMGVRFGTLTKASLIEAEKRFDKYVGFFEHDISVFYIDKEIDELRSLTSALTNV